MKISQMHQTVEKEAFVSNINLFELVVVSCLYYKENTYHRQSMRGQIVLRFWIWLISTFLNQGFQGVLQKY